jgi:glucose/arabinose dehydrogenase
MRIGRTTRGLVGLLAVAAASGCGESAKLPLSAGVGPDPTLPPPNKTVIPTLHIAPAKGWPEGGKPVAAAGTAVAAFAAPPKPEDYKGIKGRITKVVMKRAGSGGPSANRITLLRDADGDGVPEIRTVFLEGLNSPFGMALVGTDFYVANTDAVMRYPYTAGATRIDGSGIKVVELPAGPINRHWTRNLIPHRDGTKLYVTVGSNSNVAEKGIRTWAIPTSSSPSAPAGTGARPCAARSSGSCPVSSTARSASAARRARGRASCGRTARCGRPTRTA